MFKRAKNKPAARRHFGPEISKDSDYPLRLSFYSRPPTLEITIEDFQSWAIDRLIVLGEIESALYRNKSLSEMNNLIKSLTDRYLPLSSNTSRPLKGDHLELERRKDHYSHFILRLAFCKS